MHDIAVAESLLSGDIDFGTALADLTRKPSKTASYQPDRLERGVGWPTLEVLRRGDPGAAEPVVVE